MPYLIKSYENYRSYKTKTKSKLSKNECYPK